MKRLIAFFLVLSTAFSFSSCSDKKDEESTTVPDTTAEETTYDYSKLDLEGLPFRELSDITAFFDGEEKISLEKGSVSYLYSDSTGLVTNTDDEELRKITDITLPFGVRAGDSFTSVCEAFGFETGYAFYGTTGSKGGSYNEGDCNLVDFPDGSTGSLYCGYRVIEDKAYCVESQILNYMTMGLFTPSYDFDIVMVSMTFNDKEELTDCCLIYCDYKVFYNLMIG